MNISTPNVAEQGRRRSSSRHGELPLVPTTTVASTVLARPTNSTFSHEQLAMFHQAAFGFHNPNPEHQRPHPNPPQPQPQPQPSEDPSTLLIPSTTPAPNYANPHLSQTAARLELYGLHRYGAFSQPASPHVPSYQNSPAPSSSAEFTWSTPAKYPTTTTAVLTPATGYSISSHISDIESIQLPGPRWQQHPLQLSGPGNASPVPQLVVFPEPENSSASTITAPVHDFHHLQQNGAPDAAASEVESRKSSLDQQPVFMVNQVGLGPELGFDSNATAHDIDLSNFDLDDLDLDMELPEPYSPHSAPSPNATADVTSAPLSAPSTPYIGGPRAPKYTPQEWEAQRAHIRQLYLDEDRTLKELIHIMGERHGFHATPRMYNARFRMWNFSKYKKPGRAPSVAGARRRRASTSTTGASGLAGLRRSSGPSASSGSGIGNTHRAHSAFGGAATHLNLQIPRTVPTGTPQAAMPANLNVPVMTMLSPTTPTTTTRAPLMTSPTSFTPDVQFGGDFNLFP